MSVFLVETKSLALSDLLTNIKKCHSYRLCEKDSPKQHRLIIRVIVMVLGRIKLLNYY